MLILAGLSAFAALALAALYAHDRWGGHDHAILRNYPVVGHLRYHIESLGEYLRQYLFATDWDERPFNRMTRAWIYRSAKGLSNYIAFGSVTDPSEPGSVLFLNSPFPVNADEARPYRAKPIGEGACGRPYTPRSFFNISGMSYGALSAQAIQALSHGSAEAGVWLATGEGGLSPHHLVGGGDVIFQLGTAKYGARTPDGELDEVKLREIAAIEQVRMIEIKLSQGAKPGKGGILPAAKVTPEIAGIRGIPVGVDSRSPNRHAEIADIPSLIAFIDRVRRVADRPVGIKLVMGDPDFFDALFAVLANDPARAPDYIALDGTEGGTGAAPAPLADHVGLPIREALPLLVAALDRHRLRERIRVIASGKLTTPDQVAWALCAGADYVVSARGFMLAMGCIQSLKCHTGSCPTGITTHDPRFTRGLDPARKATRVAAYARAVIHDVEVIAHSCGCRDVSELRPSHMRVIGRRAPSMRI